MEISKIIPTFASHLKTSMKLNILLAVIIVTLLVGCEDNIHREITTSTYGAGVNMEEYNFDGCQYIGNLHGTEHDWCTHKGDCINPIHQSHADTVYITKPVTTYVLLADSVKR